MPEADTSLKAIKLLLQNTWPQLVAKRVKAEDYSTTPYGCVHLIDIKPSEGLVWNTLLESQITEEVKFITSEENTLFLFKVRIIRK